MAPFRATPSNYRVAPASLARAASLVMCVCYEPKTTHTQSSELTTHCVCTAVRWCEGHRWKAHHGTQQVQGPQVVRRALVTTHKPTSSPKPLARQNLGLLPNDSNSSMLFNPDHRTDDITSTLPPPLTACQHQQSQSHRQHHRQQPLLPHLHRHHHYQPHPHSLGHVLALARRDPV